MIYVLYGPDKFRAREELAAIRRELDRDGNLAHNTLRFDPDETRRLTPGDLRAACHTASFFAEARLVIIEGLHARFGAGGRRGARRGRTSARPEALEGRGARASSASARATTGSGSERPAPVIWGVTGLAPHTTGRAGG